MSRFQEYMAARAPANPLADAAIALGVPVFPCKVDKKPLTEHGFLDASRNSDVIKRMFAKPGAVMIGMPTGEITGVIVVDIDVKANRQGMDWLNANSHRMPQTRTIRTSSGGLHIYMAWPGQRVKNSNDKIAPGVDVRGDGGYVILPPSAGYVVADDAPLALVPDWFLPVLCPPEPVPTPTPSVPRPTSSHAGNTPYGQAALDRECDAIRSAPFGTQESTINAACLKVGALVAGGELIKGHALAELLAAARSVPSQPGRPAWRASELEHKVRRAMDDGLRQPRSAPDPEPEPVHPAAALLAKLYSGKAQEAAKVLPVTTGLMAVSGVLRLFVDECVRTAIRPQPFLALGAAICVVGTLAGRRYRTKTDLRTNVYVAGIAESGGGKDHAPEVARRAIEAAGLGHYLGGETLASGRAVLTAMESHPVKLFQIDEFGLFLSSVTGPKAPAHKAEVWTELMKLYSRAKGTYRGTEYANRKENPRVDIVQPCCTFYGTSTPSTFWAALAGGAMSDGSLARFLLFISDNNRPERNPSAGVFEPSDELLSGLLAVAAGRGGAAIGGGNLPQPHTATMTSQDRPDPYTVPMSEAAEEAHQKGLEAEDAWARKVEGTPQATIVNRLGENAAKLALISAISRNPSDPVISVSDVEWGWLLAEHCTRSLLQDATRYLADSDYERRINKALDLIRRHGPISESQMFDRHGWRLPERDRSEILRTLVTAGMILAIPSDRSKAGRPTVRYVLANGILPLGEMETPHD